MAPVSRRRWRLSSRLLQDPRGSQTGSVQLRPTKTIHQVGREPGEERSGRRRDFTSPLGWSVSIAYVIIRHLPTWKVERAASLWLAMGLWALRQLQRQSGRFCRTVRNRDGSGCGVRSPCCPALVPRWWTQSLALQKLFLSLRDHSPPPSPLVLVYRCVSWDVSLLFAAQLNPPRSWSFPEILGPCTR